MTYEEFKNELYYNVALDECAKGKKIKLLEQRMICVDAENIKIIKEINFGRYGFRNMMLNEDMLCAVWDENGRGIVKHWPVRDMYRNYLAERQASQGGALMAVTSGGETVNPYQLLRFSLSWDDARQTWLSADGEPVERVKDEPGVPTLTMAEDFALRYAEGAGRRYPLRIYDENFHMLSDRSPIDTAQLFFLEPGDYYLVFDTYAPGGRYIASQDGYEQSAYDCVVRLHVERQLAQPWTPGAIQYSGSAALAYAHLGSVTLTDDDSRRTLCAILDRAEETYPSECAGSVILFLTDARGRVFGLCPAQDGCGNFWSGGTWYRYGDGNELLELMNGASPGGGQTST